MKKTLFSSLLAVMADRYTFLSLGQVIGEGVADNLAGGDIRQLMAGGAPDGRPRGRARRHQLKGELAFTE